MLFVRKTNVRLSLKKAKQTYEAKNWDITVATAAPSMPNEGINAKFKAIFRSAPKHIDISEYIWMFSKIKKHE
jgi:hypothetical protein